MTRHAPSLRLSTDFLDSLITANHGVQDALDFVTHQVKVTQKDRAGS